MKKFTPFLNYLIAIIYCSFLFTNCANIIPPAGGDKDSLPPRLVKALPENNTTYFKGNRINLQFDEYVDIQNVFENVIVSPAPEKLPIVDYKLKNISIKLKDSLEPNTTYSIQFGSAIKDVNEGNIFKDFTYVFSTGSTIDSLAISGNVLVAETGKPDSSLLVALYKNLDDSAVAKQKPRYTAKPDGKGNFSFNNLPPGRFNLFAFKDEGFKKYSSNKIIFAYNNKPLNTEANADPIILYAFVAEKDDKPTTPVTPANNARDNKDDKRIKYQINLQNGELGLFNNLQLSFAKKIKYFDSSKILLTDTLNHLISGYQLKLDSSQQIVSLVYPWKEATPYKFLLLKDAVADTAGNPNTRNDTIAFKTKPETAYGTVQLRFTGLNITKNPLLQWVQNGEVKYAYPLTSNELKIKLFEPGNYEIRILYDANKNGIWDTGNYWKKIQPELVKAIEQLINIRANWDNEFAIAL